MKAETVQEHFLNENSNLHRFFLIPDSRTVRGKLVAIEATLLKQSEKEKDNNTSE